MHNNLELGTVTKLNYKADGAFFIFFGLLLLPNFLPISYDLKLTFGCVVTILGFLFITLISLGFTFRKQKRGTTPTNGINGGINGNEEQKQLSSGPKTNDTTRRVIVIFGIIYSAIAALGFQVAFDFYQPDVHNSILAFKPPDINHTFLVLGYLALAIPFYHSGIIFLTTTAAEELTKGEARRVFPNFILLFLVGVIIYYIAKDLNSVQVFVKLVMTLMIVDVGWVLYFYTATKTKPVYMEWVRYDTITFLAFILVGLYGSGAQLYWMTFLILVSRTVCDYAFAWKKFYLVYTAQP